MKLVQSTSAAALALSTLLLAFHAAAQDGDPVPPPPVYAEPGTAEPVPEPAPEPPNLPPPPPLQGPEQYAPAPPDAVPVGAERHDGFYLRAALGPAALHMSRSTEGELYGVTEEGPDSKIAGVGGLFELSIGGTPAKGLVLAGTLLVQELAEPVLDFEDGSRIDLDGTLSFVVLGPTLDFYPDAHGGFHFGGTLGLAAAVAKAPDASPFDNIGGAGGALSLLAGYDWWIGDEWSLGVLGRLSAARVRGEATERVAGVELEGTEDSNVSSAGISFSLLHH
jgi:hypothetical protein